MFVGHVAVALIGKGARPRIPLWLLIFASQAPDWLLIVGWMTGHPVARIEHFSETIYSFVLVAIPISLAYFAVSRDWRSALTIWLVSASHQVCDFFTGSKAFLPTGQLAGLGWYHHPLRDFVLEAGLVVAAAWFYRRNIAYEKRNTGILVITFGALVFAQSVLDVYLASSVRNGWLANELHTGKLIH